ncbi:MAG: hypothetical protein ACTTGJ_01175 [Clostridium sp.]
MEKKDLPKITKKTSFIETVETGCCLRSCGGSPAPISSMKTEDLKKINELLK